MSEDFSPCDDDLEALLVDAKETKKLHLFLLSIHLVLGQVASKGNKRVTFWSFYISNLLRCMIDLFRLASKGKIARRF